MIPEMQTNIKFITAKLEENDRASTVRLMKAKEMMQKQQPEKSKLEIDLEAMGKDFEKQFDLDDKD